ncbi:DUF4279 domain-containing protein [Sporosarcina thermotolerans]|uniref:DUF4279 domain-containing protein n=1 Tax=Sporosarcina thermotolerans TaxID=633404 RepID=A0AAW9AFN1_9BACL|nr:DUF4279 domain-containing protein [Sporosarcina thermotolerans]MDW0118506.1 DUF4279 domain-containing protein [Sporosarcina thermotolerans]WHT47759.1 DUF4279 domain-containing protein [Sporosarcina thermotolerans]
MDKTQVMVYFSIYGEDFPIDLVTETLGIEPTKTYKKGDAIKRPFNQNVTSTGIHYRKETAWELSTGYQESIDVKNQMDPVLGQLIGKRELINQLKAEFKLECHFSIVIVMENGYTPGLHIDNEQVEFANSIKAEFDIDLYANPYDENLSGLH